MTRRRKQKKAPALDTATQQAYKQLVAVVERANATNSKDLSEAGRLLNSHPELVKILSAIQDREYARQDALQRFDAVKGNPTGAHPQSGMSGWTGTKNYPIGVMNARLLRDWADTNEWVRAAINARRQQIERADIAVLPLDESKPYNKAVQKSMQHLLDQPNELRDSFRSLMGPVIEDVLVLDRGVISKNMTPARKPVALYYEDGSTIKIYPEWTGDPKEPRYLYEEPGSNKKIPLLNDELIVIMANGATYRYGLSPVQVLRQTIVADLEAMRSGSDLVANKPPPIAFQMPGASDTQIRGFINNYDNNIAGRKELFAFGGPQPANMFRLVYSAKDNQWLEWQEYLARKICAIFQISPQQIGLTFDINKATSGTQQQIFEDTGLIPLLLLIEEYLNRELLSDFAPKMSGDRFNLDALNLRIVFPEVSEAARQMHIERVLQMAETGLAGMPSQTPNMILQAMGQEPIKGGNTLWVNTTTGPMPWLSYDNEYGDWQPPITGGALGAQDPAGGPGDAGDDDMGLNEDTSSSDSDSNAAEAAQQSASSGSAPAQSAEKHMVYRDARKPGTKWSPSMLTLAKTPPAQHWQDTDVLIQDALKKMKEKGVISQTWKAGPNSCDPCLSNDGQTIRLGERFNSGAMSTPEHGNCECTCTENKEAK